MPIIWPFDISDKNTYYPKLMYTVMLILIFDFSKFVFVTLLYIHISPPYNVHIISGIIT